MGAKGKRPFGRPWSRRVKTIRIDLKGIVCEGVGWKLSG
jgi:hypothetical protein